MRLRLLRLAAATAILAVPAGAFAQNDQNAHVWFNYFGDHPLRASKVEVHLEAQVRRSDFGANWQQLLLRPGLNVQVTKAVTLSGGYGFVETWPYGQFPAKRQLPEHRTFEQVQFTPHAGGLDWQNRLRLEQRHIGGLSKRYENRLRYMLRTNVPLRKSTKYYLAFYDEVFINFGDQVAFNTFDQNRAYAALGMNFPHKTRFETGFLEQTVQHRDGRVFEHNHTLQVALYAKLPLGTP